MSTTSGEWRVEAVSDCVRVVVGNGRKKIILARLSPKQIPESETHANARLMAAAPKLLGALVSLEASGAIGGESHPLNICGCWGCQCRRLIREAGGSSVEAGGVG